VFAKVDACVEPVLSPAQALAEAKRIDVDVDGRVYGFIGLGLDAPGVRARAPSLGQHNEELLGLVTI
jgi:hypothetical protein